MATSAPVSRPATRDPRPETVQELDYRPSYLAAAIASAIVFALYLLTLAPSTAMWDTSEYITAAYTLGLPHPPGNPLFVLIGRVFAVLPIPGSVAVRINVLAALSANRRRSGCYAHRRHGVHRVEPVRREREGVHGLAHGHRDHLLADD